MKARLTAAASALWPRSLFGQILCALLGGLLLANALGLWLVIDDRARLSRHMRGEYAAARIAESIALIDDTAPAGRARLLRLLESPATTLSLDEPWYEHAMPVDDEFEVFADKVHERIASRYPHQVITLAQRADRPPPTAGDPPSLRPPPPPPPPLADLLPRAAMSNVSTQARLGDGSVLTFRYAPPPAAAERPLRVVGSLLLVAVAVSLLSIWGVRRLTRPLDMFARAADGLARDLEQAPLAENGPREVASAARAFNHMQRALRTLIQTRAQALAGVSQKVVAGDSRTPVRAAPISPATACMTSTSSRARFSIDPP